MSHHPASEKTETVAAGIAKESDTPAARIPSPERGRASEAPPWRGLAGFERSFVLHMRAAEQFYKSASLIGGEACPVGPPQGDWRTTKHHFFSTFFLAVTQALCRDDRRMPLYAMVNMAMRVWVTGCDNLLDDEYKETLGFLLPEGGPRMRSVLSIMIADRVLAEYVRENYPEAELSTLVARSSLRALMPSAVQEMEEECRPVEVLPPEDLIGSVHQRKTALLFAAPLMLPAELESPPAAAFATARRAVTSLGLGCQVLDDIKDMPADVSSGRHNLLVSIETARRGETEWLRRLRSAGTVDWVSWQKFPDACAQAGAMAGRFFADCFAAIKTLGMVTTPDEWWPVVMRLAGLLAVPPDALLFFPETAGGMPEENLDVF